MLNNSEHEATGHTLQELFLTVEWYNPFQMPFHIPYGYHAQRTKIILACEVQEYHAERHKHKHDQRTKPVSFFVSDLVLIRIHRLSSNVDQTISKFFLLYEFSFVVFRRTAYNVYIVGEPTTRVIQDTYNIVHLWKYGHPDPYPLQFAKAVTSLQEP